MDKNPACWFDIYVQDMMRAKAFYETVTSSQAISTDRGQYVRPALHGVSGLWGWLFAQFRLGQAA